MPTTDARDAEDVRAAGLLAKLIEDAFLDARYVCQTHDTNVLCTLRTEAMAVRLLGRQSFRELLIDGQES